jgi:hypothetical protein
MKRSAVIVILIISGVALCLTKARQSTSAANTGNTAKGPAASVNPTPTPHGSDGLHELLEPVASADEALNSGLNLADIPNFKLPPDFVCVYDMARSYENRSTLLELQKGFTHYAHTRLSADGLYNKTPYEHRMAFNNTQNDAKAKFKGDPFSFPNIDVKVPSNYQKWVQVARVLGTTPDGVNGLVFDIERWDWSGNAAYQQAMANVHTLLFKTAWQDANNSKSTNKKPIICWGPYAPTELSTTDLPYTNVNASVNITYKTPSQSGEYWWQYVTHDLPHFYYRSEDSADNFKLKMYANIIVMETTLNYRNGAKPSLCGIWLHQENASASLVPDHVAEYMAIMPVMAGVKGFYCWHEAGYARMGDGRNWNPYKKFVKGLYRVSQLADILTGNPVFHRNNTEISLDGGKTFITPKPRFAYDNQIPMVRAITNGDKIAIAACNPFAATDIALTSVIVRIAGQQFRVTMKGKQTTLLRN